MVGIFSPRWHHAPLKHAGKPGASNQGNVPEEVSCTQVHVGFSQVKIALHALLHDPLSRNPPKSNGGLVAPRGRSSATPCASRPRSRARRAAPRLAAAEAAAAGAQAAAGAPPWSPHAPWGPHPRFLNLPALCVAVRRHTGSGTASLTTSSPPASDPTRGQQCRSLAGDSLVHDVSDSISWVHRAPTLGTSKFQEMAWDTQGRLVIYNARSTLPTYVYIVDDAI